MFKFLHAADLHLDSPLKGLSRYEDAPLETMRQATRGAFENLVRTAIDEQVAFVLIAGDLYDGDWNDHATGSFFLKRASLLRDAGIPLFVIAGNHDAANKMTKTLDLRGIATMLDHRRPQTCHLDHWNVTIHGQSYARQDVSDDLSLSYPAAVKGNFNVGMLHTCASVVSEHPNYAPCSLEGLRNRGYDYWALGHVHNRQVLHASPQIVFPGNLQGRHARETGPKGAYLVTVQDDHSTDLEFRPLDVFRWEHVQVDVSKASTAEDALQAVNEALTTASSRTDGLPAAVRVELVGRSAVHRQLTAKQDRYRESIRVEAYQVAANEFWLEKIQFHTQPQQSSRTSESSGAWGQLSEQLQSFREQPEELNRLQNELQTFLDKFPAELLQAAGCDKELWWRDVLTEVESRLNQELFAEPTE